MIRPADIIHFIHDIFVNSQGVSEEERHWAETAQSLPLGAFIMWLANEVTTEMMCQARKEHGNFDQLIKAVENGDAGLQSDAERFLQKQHIDCDPTQVRRITIFRHLIQIRLRHAK